MTEHSAPIPAHTPAPAHPGGYQGGHSGAHPGGHPHGPGHKHLMTEVPRDPRDVQVNPDEVNARTNYSLHAVFQTGAPFPQDKAQRETLVTEVLSALEEKGVTIRGWYDVAAFRSDADLMVWLLDEDVDKLQDCYHLIMNSRLGACLVPVFSLMCSHMTAEFNAPHLPACFGGWAPRKYLAVYPFTRSLEWYYLPKARRRAMLAEHGMNGKDYLDVAVSTLAAFALNDYEWSVSLEHDDLQRVMGVLRIQRECEARLHVRVDTPFYTGKRMELGEWMELQPTEAVLN